jgi:hypothetical protein
MLYDPKKRFNVVTPAGYIPTDSILEAQAYKRHYGYPYIRSCDATGYKVPAEMNIVIKRPISK